MYFKEEDPYFTDERMVEIITAIKKRHPNNAITLSLGERSYESYKIMFEAGADRYLLRHETASKNLYESLHPKASFEERRQCLYNLREIGYQVGSGFMVGLPKQSNEDLVEDLMFIKELKPHMCGIGPLSHIKILHYQWKLEGQQKNYYHDVFNQTYEPKILLPSTTALGSIDPLGREKGLKAGGNVVMPNLSPTTVREKYSLYNGKICTGDEAAECRMCIENRINKAGFTLEISRGDSLVLKDDNRTEELEKYKNISKVDNLTFKF